VDAPRTEADCSTAGDECSIGQSVALGSNYTLLLAKSGKESATRR
jgi:hypothetical protein